MKWHKFGKHLKIKVNLKLATIFLSSGQLLSVKPEVYDKIFY